VTKEFWFIFFDTLHKQVHGKETEVAESSILFLFFILQKNNVLFLL